MEIEHVGGKQTSIKVSRCVFGGRICFTPQLTVLAFGGWITRTTAVFPLRTRRVVSLRAHDRLNSHLNAARHSFRPKCFLVVISHSETDSKKKKKDQLHVPDWLTHHLVAIVLSTHVI